MRWPTPERMARHVKLSEEKDGRERFWSEGNRLGDIFDNLYIAKVNPLTTPLFLGIRQMLEELSDQGVAMGALTNANVAYGRAVVHAHKFGEFFPVVHGAPPDVPAAKPAPDGLVQCAKELGVLPSKSVYVGDSPTDGQAARAADYGLAVGVAWGSNKRAVLEPAFDCVVDSVEELRLVLETPAQPYLMLDCDGTMAETEPLYLAAMNAAFEAKGLQVVWDKPQYLELMREGSTVHRLRHYFDTRGWPEGTPADGKSALVLELKRAKDELFPAVLAEAVRADRFCTRPGILALIKEALAAGEVRVRIVQRILHTLRTLHTSSTLYRHCTILTTTLLLLQDRVVTVVSNTSTLIVASIVRALVDDDTYQRMVIIGPDNLALTSANGLSKPAPVRGGGQAPDI
jgi:phosphoglycolate phosphatase-like HAD superfamily hydrolase